MDLFDVHNDLIFLANKEQNYWPHEDIDKVLHRAQWWLFNEYYEVYGKTQTLHDAMSPFKVAYTFTPDNTPGGLITLKPKYEHLLGFYVQYYDNDLQRVRYDQIDIVNEDELGYRLNSQLTPVEITSPIATIVSSDPDTAGLQLYPKEPNTGNLTYLRQPARPVFAYSIDGRKVNYNKNNSTQLEWNESSINQIIIKALQFLGVNISATQLVQYTEMKDQQKT